MSGCLVTILRYRQGDESVVPIPPPSRLARSWAFGLSASGRVFAAVTVSVRRSLATSDFVHDNSEQMRSGGFQGLQGLQQLRPVNAISAHNDQRTTGEIA